MGKDNLPERILLLEPQELSSLASTQGTSAAAQDSRVPLRSQPHNDHPLSGERRGYTIMLQVIH